MSSNQPSSKPDLYVIARIVNVVREQGPTLRTQLAVLTWLSYDSLVRYLEWMSHKGLDTIDANEVIHLTEEGHKVYDRLVSWILEYVGALRFPRF